MVDYSGRSYGFSCPRWTRKKLSSMDLVDIFKDVFNTPKDDDSIDRLNHTFTSLILLLFAVVVSTEQYVGTPIKCWTPPQFTDNFVSYTQKICWIQDTYIVPMNMSIPETNNYAGKRRLRYYQWTPILFLICSISFCLPCLFWRAYNTSRGLNLNTIVDIGTKYHEADDNDKKDEQIKILTKHFNCYLENKKYNPPTVCVSKHKSLTFIYITSKLFYLLNAIAQLLITDLLLCSGQIRFYGLILARNAIAGVSGDSYFFPRVSLCDFHIREMGKVVQGHIFTVQCVLSINIYLEAIFGFYWFWLCLLIILNLRNTWSWCLHALSTYGSRAYILKYIRPELRNSFDILNRETGNMSAIQKTRIDRFVDQYLDSDGVFVMRLVSQNVSHVVATDLVSALYENYKILDIADKWGQKSSESFDSD